MFGKIVEAIAPETEADPAGILLSLLAGFGNAVSRGPTFRVGKGLHRPNLFVVLLAKAGVGKGEAWEIASDLLGKADADWAIDCIAYGMGSGEGLVDRVRDAVVEREPIKGPDGSVSGWTQTVIDPGAKDKRLLCVEEEFAKPLALMKRDDSTLSAHVRNAWGGRTLEVMNRRKNAIKATDAHVSILGHITPEELLATLPTVSTQNGFLNRFLLASVRRSKLLPDGGDDTVIDRFGEPLREALEKAKTIATMSRSQEAGRRWHEVYERLATADAVATERARSQVLRLSMIYALADGFAEVSLAHLEAALAVWDYCESSALALFTQDNNNPSPTEKEPLWLRLLHAINAKPGISRTEIRDVAGHKLKADVIEDALAHLEASDLAHRRKVKPDGPVASAECWYPGPSPDDGGEEQGREGMNSDTPAGGVPSLHTGGKSGERIPPGDGANSLPPSTAPPAERQEQTADAKAEGRSPEGGGFVVDARTKANAENDLSLEEFLKELRVK